MLLSNRLGFFFLVTLFRVGFLAVTYLTVANLECRFFVRSQLGPSV